MVDSQAVLQHVFCKSMQVSILGYSKDSWVRGATALTSNVDLATGFGMDAALMYDYVHWQ